MSKAKETKGTEAITGLPNASAGPPEAVLPKPRNWTKAEVYLLGDQYPRQLVKDYSRCSLPARLAGRLFLHLEERALAQLTGVQGIPNLYRRIGKNALCMEFIDATPLSELDGNGGVPPDFGDQLAALFAEIEARGVVHGDPHFTNILCDAQGQPYLVDFAFSYIRGTIPLLDGWIFQTLRDVHQRRLRKLRRIFYHETIEDIPPAGMISRGFLALQQLYKKQKKARKRRKNRHGIDQEG